MTEAPSAPGAAERDRDRNPDELPNYGALDLGTNNCRLLIATPQGGSFRVVEAYSRIVRLGEGLSQSGRLSEAAMERALAALKVSAEKVRRRRVVRLRAIATQACRMAENDQDFLDEAAVGGRGNIGGAFGGLAGTLPRRRRPSRGRREPPHATPR